MATKRKKKRAAHPPRKRKRATARAPKRRRAPRRTAPPKRGTGFRFEVSKVKLDRRGYDARGRYHGRVSGQRLYQVRVVNKITDLYHDALVHARTVADAKASVQEGMMRGVPRTHGAAPPQQHARSARPKPPPPRVREQPRPGQFRQAGPGSLLGVGVEYRKPSSENRSVVGYRNCACRDCMETAYGQVGAMCNACESAGCSGLGECQAEGAYGG